MKKRLTDNFINNAAKRGTEYRDEVTRGLILRYGKKGLAVWEVMISRGGRRVRKRLGMHPALSVKDARIAAEAAKLEELQFSTGSNVKTVDDLFSLYEAARSPDLRSWVDVESAWRVWGSPHIGRVRVSDLSFNHGISLRKHVTENSSALRAGSVIRCLRPMLAWAADERLIEKNPWVDLRVGASSQSRQRVLHAAEWAALWEFSGKKPYPFGPFLGALMLSAQRLSNVAQMRWDELRGDVWLIPRNKMKATRAESAQSHEVPLSNALAELLAAQPRNGPFVFTTTGKKPIVPGSKFRTEIETSTGVSDWRFHDIRRTGATLMTTGNETRKVSRFIVARVLGHEETSVTATYDRSAYRDEKREALEVLAASVSRSITTTHALGSVEALKK